MNDSLGLDHPLVAVRDMAAARQTYAALGFTLSPQGMHPWGTATSLVLFRQQILEIVGIGDASLLDGYPAGDFSFGRHVERHLIEREGVALSALFTDDSDAVEARLTSRNLTCAGTINFGRDVVRADGEPDRTSTTLKIFPNAHHPRLSVFACHQHRRDLLEFPHMMEHANGAHGIEAVTVGCIDSDRDRVMDWLSSVHSVLPTSTREGESEVATSNGYWRICSPQSLEHRFGSCDVQDFHDNGPSIVGIDIRVGDLDLAHQYVRHASPAYIDNALVLQDHTVLGGVMLRFVI